MVSNAQPCEHNALLFVIVGPTVFIRCETCNVLAQLRMTGDALNQFSSHAAHTAMRFEKHDKRLDTATS